MPSSINITIYFTPTVWSKTLHNFIFKALLTSSFSVSVNNHKSYSFITRALQSLWGVCCPTPWWAVQWAGLFHKGMGGLTLSHWWRETQSGQAGSALRWLRFKVLLLSFTTTSFSNCMSFGFFHLCGLGLYNNSCGFEGVEYWNILWMPRRKKYHSKRYFCGFIQKSIDGAYN